MATAPTKDKMQPQDRPVETSVLEFKKPLAVDEEGNPIRVDYAGAHAKIDPAEIKLVRKLDLWIIPTLWLMYWLNFLDRNAIALARLNTLEEDLNLTSTQFQTCVSILFVGYVLGQIPSNMYLTRTRPSLYMSGCMALWAIVSTLTAITRDFKGLLLTRFFLGITEAPFFPGALFMLSSFYTRKEIATRISILYTGNVLATAFAGLIAAGVFHGMDGLRGWAGWRWLFLLQGVVTFAVAIASAFTLPDHPLSTRWLTASERQLAHERIERDTVDNRYTTSTWSGLKEAAQDSKVWLFVLIIHLQLAPMGFKNFFPTVVNTLGFGQTVTLVLTCPPYLVAGGMAVLLGMSSGKFNERTWHVTGAKLTAAVGFALGCATLNIGARYFAMVLFATGTISVNSILLGWVSATCGQTMEKKAASLAIVNTFGTCASIWSPYLWPKGDGPRYTMAMSTFAALSLACVAAVWVMKVLLIRANKKIRQRDDETVLFYAY